jgi:RNA polymerase sigma factor (sigma-70 family)
VRTKELKIIDSLKNGENKEHINMLYEEYFPKIRKYITYNSGSLDDALDIFHDTILILHKSILQNKLEQLDKLEGFIYVTAKNLWINNRNKKNARELRESKYAESNEDNYYLEKIENSEKISSIKNAFNQLEEKCREILSLTILTDIPMDEISDRLGYSNGNVLKTLNYRCKKKLKNLIYQTPGLTNFLSK